MAQEVAAKAQGDIREMSGPLTGSLLSPPGWKHRSQGVLGVLGQPLLPDPAEAGAESQSPGGK